MKLNSKLCAIDATRTIFETKMCTTGVLERTRSHEIENDLNYNEEFLDFRLLEPRACCTLFALIKTLTNIMKKKENKNEKREI